MNFSCNIPYPDRLPDVLKAESYAFVALPAEAFWDGQVNSENIKRGRLCPIRDLPKTGWIHGITLFSKVCKSKAIEPLAISFILRQAFSCHLHILFYSPGAEIRVDSSVDERTWDSVLTGGFAFKRINDEHWHQHTIYSGAINGCAEKRRWWYLLMSWRDVTCMCWVLQISRSYRPDQHFAHTTYHTIYYVRC